MNLTDVFSLILSGFRSIADLLFNRLVISIGSFQISIGTLSLLLILLYAVFSLLLPWFDDSEDD